MPDFRPTIIPQFTIRWMLSATAVLAVVSLVVSYALRGAPWAAGISIGFAALLIALVVYGVLFSIAWLLASFLAARRARRQRRPPPAVQSLLFLALAAAALAVQSRRVMAASGGTITLPALATGQTNNTGLTLDIDTAWVDGAGYRPVWVRIRSIAGPVTADRVLTLSFRTGESPSEGSVTCIQTVEIPAGSLSAEAMLAVPQTQQWYFYQLDTYENGERLTQLSITSGMTWTSGSSSIDSPVPNVVMLDSAGNIAPTEAFFLNQPNSRSFETALSFGGLSTSGQFVLGQGLSGSAPMRTGPLPARWIDYTSVDIIMTSLANLQTLVRNPDQWAAIRSWWNNGGTLAVYDLGDRWEKLDEFERLVSLPNKEPSTEEADDPQRRGWELPREGRHIVAKRTENGIEYTRPDGSPVTDLGQELRAADDEEPGSGAADRVPLDRAPFLTRNVGSGLLVAIRAEPNELNKDYPWLWLYNTIDQRRWQGSQRIGVSMAQDNEEFWDFLIPGVGLAPVTQFQVLISLFVLLIGPVNYIVLRRRGKLNLMVITVPVAALTVTAALFAYAVVADGLGVRLRARSFTHIDQRTGEATCWARQSYYAGLAPSGGLTFSENTAVYPMEPTLSDYRLRRGVERTIEWRPADRSDPKSPQVQRLTEGWLRARTPTQLVTGRIRNTSARLEIAAAGAGQSPQVVNRLGTRIERLILLDESANCFVGGATDRDQSVQLQAVESQATAYERYLQPLILENLPRPPLGGDFRSYPAYSTRFQRRVYNPGLVGGQLGTVLPPTMGNSLLERSISELKEAMNKNLLPPGAYVAVVERSPEVELGTPAAREEASFHIVVGEW